MMTMILLTATTALTLHDDDNSFLDGNGGVGLHDDGDDDYTFDFNYV
jgi:hypothetical protein